MDGLIVLRTLRRTLSTAVARHWIHATLVEGVLSETEGPYRCLFVENRGFMEYLRPHMFGSESRMLSRKRMRIARLSELVENPPVDLDLCISVLPLSWEPQLRHLCAFRTTEWVRQTLDRSHLPRRSEERMRKKTRTTLARVRRHGLTYRISQDPADLKHFYHRMYVPHIRSQFQGGAAIDRLHEMERYFSQGCLLLVQREGVAIAGALLHWNGDQLIWRRSGILEGDKEYVRMGAQSALYYFTLEYAGARALDRVDLMKSRPFLQDGVFAHKREWGATVQPDAEADASVLYFPLRRLERFAAFVQANPLIVTTDQGLKALVGSSSSEGEGSERIRADLDRYLSPGLAGVLIQTPTQRHPADLSAIP